MLRITTDTLLTIKNRYKYDVDLVADLFEIMAQENPPLISLLARLTRASLADGDPEEFSQGVAYGAALFYALVAEQLAQDAKELELERETN